MPTDFFAPSASRLGPARPPAEVDPPLPRGPEVDSRQWAGRAGAEMSPRPRRRGRPAGVAIPPPPESNFPPGGAPGRDLSSAPGRGLSVCPAPAPPGAVCRSVRASRGTERASRIPVHGRKRQRQYHIQWPTWFPPRIVRPHAPHTMVMPALHTIACIIDSTIASNQHHPQQHHRHSVAILAGASMLAPVRLTAYCARGRAVRAPAARAHGVATKKATPRTRKRLE